MNKKKNKEGQELTLKAEHKPEMTDSPPFIYRSVTKPFALLFQLGQISNTII